MRITPIAAAAIVAAGLVTAPDTTDVAISRHTPTIQIHSLAVDLTSTVLSTVSENATADHTASAAPQASLSVSQELKSAVTYATVTAALIALTPVWYATFPVTIPPVSLAVAGYVVAALSILSGGLKQSYIPLALGLGLEGGPSARCISSTRPRKTTGRYIKSLVDPAPPPKRLRRQALRRPCAKLAKPREARPARDGTRTPTGHHRRIGQPRTLPRPPTGSAREPQEPAGASARVAMNESTRQGGNTSRVAAVAVAATIALGLLSAPVPADTAVTRQALAIHTQTIAVDLTAVAAQISLSPQQPPLPKPTRPA